MASNTPSKFEQEMMDYLKEHPCDPQYEEDANTYDAFMPWDQFLSYLARDVVERYEREQKAKAEEERKRGKD